MNEIEGMRWQIGRYHAGLVQQMDRLYNGLEELERMTLMLLEHDVATEEEIDQWLEQEGFSVDEDGFFQSVPLLTAFRAGRASKSAISFSWGQHLRTDHRARKHLFLHRNMGPYLKHIHDRLGDVGWIYYQDAGNISLQYPFIDQRTAIPSDFDWSTYHTYLSASPESNPDRHIQWTPPTIDYAGEGLILSVSIPVWRSDEFIGLWSIDLPIRYVYRDFGAKKSHPDQSQFIVTREGLLVLHEKLQAEIDQPRGKVVLHSINELGGDWENIDVGEMGTREEKELVIVDRVGTEWVYCYSYVPGVEWTLFCGLPKQVMEEAAADRLSQAFQQIADGNYSHRIESSPTNALHTLVDEFNKMSLRLSKAEEHRSEMENQLHQAQKMEAIGRLAGGVAHDFNNMINVIMGYSELALEQVEAKDPLHADLLAIFDAARRSMILTRQLLAFARRQPIAPKVLDINHTLDSMIKMLQHLIGEDIELIWSPGKKVWPMLIDPSQLDQILANLCVNARDAIADVGKLIIETKNIQLDEDYCTLYRGFKPGDFVQLSVSDDGIGMKAEIVDKVFEPFFTTKGIGHGTGLGLATVYGIVKQNDGYINVFSEPGEGTTFKIYLPRVKGKTVDTHAAESEEIARGHNETILLVEDEIAILRLAERMLSKLGYRVISVSSPTKAFTIVEQHPTKIDLLITDVIMPDINGRDLAIRLQNLRHGLKVLFMSGYTSNIIFHRGILDEDVHLIQKPFSILELGTKVREALDSPVDKK